MPTYDFVCGDCKHEYELFLPRFIREEDKVCPQCGSTNVEQSIQKFNMFIGSGASGKGNTGASGGGTAKGPQKFTKYKDVKYHK